MKTVPTLAPTLLALAAALAAGGACAQAAAPAAPSGVTIYGLLDTGLEHVTDVGPAGDGLTRMPGLTGSLPSRIGFRGSEDLGGGLRAVFTLEQGLSMDSGVLNQGGRVFGRQALVGLSGPWGTVSLGRQYTMLYWSIFDADLLGPNIYGAGSLDPYIPNARIDNSLAWRGTFPGGLTLGATYSFGRDTVNAGPSPSGTNCAGESATDSKACRQWSAMAKVDRETWGAALAVDEIRGGPGAFAGLTSSAQKDTRVSANGYLRLADWKLGAGLIRRDNDASAATPRSDLWYAGASYRLTPALTLEGELFSLDFKGSGDDATMAALRATQALSKRTSLYATLGHIRNRGASAISVSSGAPGSAPAPGASQSAAMVGVRHVF